MCNCNSSSMNVGAMGASGASNIGGGGATNFFANLSGKANNFLSTIKLPTINTSNKIDKSTKNYILIVVLLVLGFLWMNRRRKRSS